MSTRYATNSLSKSAILQAERAARKIAREAIEMEWEVVDTEVGPREPSEALLESSYDEARDRNIYQSDESYDLWLDWRTMVEEKVIDIVGVPEAETEGERSARLAQEYTDLSAEIREQRKMIEEVRLHPKFPEDHDDVLPAMERDLDYMEKKRARLWTEISEGS